MPRNAPPIALRGTFAAAFAAALVLALPQSALAAASVDFDFSSGYALDASPAGQNGWTGPAGYDVELVSNADYPTSGLDGTGASLRISNSLFPGGDISHATSPQTAEADAAGESSVSSLNTFTASYTVAPASGYVEGVSIEVSPGHGTNRAGGNLLFRHADGELEISTMWVPSDAANATLPAWRSAVLGTFDPTVPHEIQTVTHLLDDANDLTEVYVDGALIAYAPTWEYYHRLSTGNPDEAKTIRGLNFRGSRSAPSADGIGYESGLDPVVSDGLLFTDISYATSSTPDWAPGAGVEPPLPIPAADDSLLVAGEFPEGALTGDGTGGTIDLGPEAADQLYAVFHYSAPTFVGWFTAGPTGALSYNLPAGLAPGVHKLAVYDSTGAFVGWGSFLVPPSGGGAAQLPVTGEEVPYLAIGISSATVILGAVLVTAAVRRRKARHLA